MIYLILFSIHQILCIALRRGNAMSRINLKKSYFTNINAKMYTRGLPNPEGVLRCGSRSAPRSLFPDINQKKLTSTTLATRGRMRGCRESECTHARPLWNVPSPHGQPLPVPRTAMDSRHFQIPRILFETESP